MIDYSKKKCDRMVVGLDARHFESIVIFVTNSSFHHDDDDDYYCV